MGRHLPEGVDLRLPDAVQLSNARQAVLRLRTVGCPYAGREHLIACVDVRRDLLATRNDGRPPICWPRPRNPRILACGHSEVERPVGVAVLCILVARSGRCENSGARALITFDWFNYRLMTV